MQPSNLVKVLVISMFTMLTIACSKGEKNGGETPTWSPLSDQELRQRALDYEPMNSESYDKPEVMQTRDELIKSLFGDGVSISFAEYLNANFATNEELNHAANTFINFYLSFSLDHRKPIVNNIKDMETQYDGAEDIQTTMSPVSGMSVMAQLNRIIVELKKTQSNGQSMWGPRDIQRTRLINQLMHERTEDEINKQFWQKLAGQGVMATMGGAVIVLFPKVVSASFVGGLKKFISEASDRVFASVQKVPGLGSLLKKGGNLDPKDIVKYSNPKPFGTRMLQFTYRYLTLSGMPRVHFSNTMKVRHHFANLLYSTKNKLPSRWRSKNAPTPSEDVVDIAMIAGERLKGGLDNIAFNPRFRANNPTNEDHALLYFTTAYRVSMDQDVLKKEFRDLYANAIDEIDLSRAERAEFKRQFSRLVNENTNLPPQYKDLAVEAEKDFLLAQKHLIPGVKTRKKYGEYGEELDYAWDPSSLPLTDTIYTDTMINRLTHLRMSAGDGEKQFIDQALDLVYKNQKYDVLNIGEMRLILKKNKGEVEKVFVGRPASIEESTTFELKTVKQGDNDLSPLKESGMSQQEFLSFMDQTVRSIRQNEVLTPVLNLTKMGFTPVGYSSMSKNVGNAMYAKLAKKNYDEMYNFSGNKKTTIRGRLAKTAKNGIMYVPKRVNAFFQNKDTDVASEAGIQYIKNLADKPANVDRLIEISKNNVDKDIHGLVSAVDELTDTSIEQSRKLSARLETASDDIKIHEYKEAIRDVNAFPIATSLKHELFSALDSGKIKPDLNDIKSFLKKRAPHHIKAQKENMDKVVEPLLKNQAFLSVLVKHFASHPGMTSDSLRLVLKGEGVKGLTEEQAQTRILIELYHNINFVLYKKNVNLNKLSKDYDGKMNDYFDDGTGQWTASFYDRNLRGDTRLTEKEEWISRAKLLVGALGFMGVAEMAQQDIAGLDLHSGMFIDDSVNALNMQAITGSKEYELFEEIISR